jgi:Tfp pilus assembly protein PilV
MTHFHGQRKRAAFTLIETALAMLAIGLGLLAFFGLGRLGLQSNRESLNDQRCAMLSSAIFETLREYNARFTEDARTSTDLWGDLWIGVLSGSTAVPFPAVADMNDDESLPLHFWKSGDPIFTPAYATDKIRLSDWNPRYRLYMSGETESSIASAINAIRFTLTIYPDGNTVSSDARTYTTTLTNPGGLP